MNNREVVRVVRRKKSPLFEEKKKERLPRTASYSLTDELAGGQFHYKNYFVSQLKANFLDSSQLWHVDKMYPYADGGLLFIDEPQTPEQIDHCLLKKIVMKEAGLRYIYITAEMDLIDCLTELGGQI